MLPTTATRNKRMAPSSGPKSQSPCSLPPMSQKSQYNPNVEIKHSVQPFFPHSCLVPVITEEGEDGRLEVVTGAGVGEEKVQTKAKTGRRRRWSRRRIRQKEKVRHPVQRPDRDVTTCLLVIAATTTTSARSLSGANIRRIPSLPSTYCSMCSTMNSTNQSGRNEALVDGSGIEPCSNVVC